MNKKFILFAAFPFFLGISACNNNSNTASSSMLDATRNLTADGTGYQKLKDNKGFVYAEG